MHAFRNRGNHILYEAKHFIMGLKSVTVISVIQKLLVEKQKVSEMEIINMLHAH